MARHPPLRISRGSRALSVDPPVAAAPMAGVVDPPFRGLIHGLGCPLSFTEMISARGVVERNPATHALIGSPTSEGACGIQLFGADPVLMERAAGIVTPMGFSMIDLNAGCPKRKVHTQGAGGALLRKPDLLVQLLRVIIGSTHLPVGVKLRSGWKEYDRRSFRSLIEGLTEAGVSYIAIHPRTVEQGFRGAADPDVIGHSRERTHLPILASGDVNAPQDAERYFEAGADAVMIGRGLMGDPEWFARFRAFEAGGPWTTYRDDVSQVTRHLDLASRHLDLQISHYGEEKGVRDFRPHLSWYLKGLRGRAILHDAVFSIADRSDVLRVLEQARVMWLVRP
jgi:nifR3 family TIM-barrel protein